MADQFNLILKKFPEKQRRALLETIERVEILFPFAERAIAWGMPTLKIGEDNLCHVMGFKNHNSLFPSSGSIASLHSDALKNMVVSKGTIHFDLESAFPKALLKNLLLSRLNQINESYPKNNGSFVEYYKNGAIKAIGKYRQKEMHGEWKFFRLDGSLMRSGRFNAGKQTGIWRTFDKSGREVKATTF